MYLIPLTLCLFVYGTKHDKSVETITTSWSLYEFSLCTKRVLESIVYLPAEATFTTNCCVLNQSRFISRYKQLLRSSFDTCYFCLLLCTKRVAAVSIDLYHTWCIHTSLIRQLAVYLNAVVC